MVRECQFKLVKIIITACSFWIYIAFMCFKILRKRQNAEYAYIFFLIILEKPFEKCEFPEDYRFSICRISYRFNCNLK